MKIVDRAGQTKKTPSIAEEMRQAFADWVDKLPFSKRENPRDFAIWKESEEESAYKASTPGPTDDRFSEPAPDNKRKAR